MAHFLFAVLLVAPILSAQEPKGAAKSEATSVKVEVRAKLRVTGQLGKIASLETPAKPGSPGSYSVDEDALATGASVETEQLGVVEVYVADDTRLQKLAKSLDGKTVLISGDLERFTYYSSKTLAPVEVAIWNASNKTTVMMPSWVTKTFIRVKKIEAAP
jgi:hypothetical protein